MWIQLNSKNRYLKNWVKLCINPSVLTWERRESKSYLRCHLRPWPSLQSRTTKQIYSCFLFHFCFSSSKLCLDLGLTLPPFFLQLNLDFVHYFSHFSIPSFNNLEEHGSLFFLVSRFHSPREQPFISDTSRRLFSFGCCFKVNPVFSPWQKNGEYSQDSAIKSIYLRWGDNLFTCSDVYIMSWASLV